MNPAIRGALGFAMQQVLSKAVRLGREPSWRQSPGVYDFLLLYSSDSDPLTPQ
jgi:hypothetical protein